MDMAQFLRQLNSQHYHTHTVKFFDDALSVLGLTDHPKAAKLRQLAWEHGHAEGFHNVWFYLQEFSELLKD